MTPVSGQWCPWCECPPEGLARILCAPHRRTAGSTPPGAFGVPLHHGRIPVRELSNAKFFSTARRRFYGSGVSTTPRSRTEWLRASPPLLPWPSIDRFTRVHPATPLVIYVPVVAVCAVVSVMRTSVLSTVALVLAGYVVWTLVEYWMHRVVFHWEPDHGIGAQLHWLIHG